MTFKSLKGKINVLKIVRQWVPGCGTNGRPPYVDRLTRGKSSSPRPAERMATKNAGHRLAECLQVSRCRHLYTWTHTLNRTRSTTSNKWSSLKCHRMQGNVVPHHQFLAQGVPPPHIVTLLLRGTRALTDSGSNVNATFFHSMCFRNPVICQIWNRKLHALQEI